VSNLTVYRGMKLTKDLAQKGRLLPGKKDSLARVRSSAQPLRMNSPNRKPAFDELDERIVAAIGRLA
jgi:hypothetical protein